MRFVVVYGWERGLWVVVINGDGGVGKWGYGMCIVCCVNRVVARILLLNKVTSL